MASADRAGRPGALSVLLLLTSDVDLRLFTSIAATRGAVSGTPLLAHGRRLRRLARTWLASGTAPQAR